MVNSNQTKNSFFPSRRNFLKNAAISGGAFAAVLTSSNSGNAQEQVPDELAVQKLAIKFIDATNRRDVELLKSIWMKDGTWMLGEPSGKVVTGIENIADHWQNLLSQFDFMTQIVNNGLVEVNGDRAKARWYMQEFAHSPAGKDMMNYGIYLDELEKTNGNWFFAQRSYKVLYLEEFDATGKVFPMPNAVKNIAI